MSITTNYMLDPMIKLLLDRTPSPEMQLYIKLTQEGKVVTKGDKTQVLEGYPEHVPLRAFTDRIVAAPQANAALGQDVDRTARSKLVLLYNGLYARLTEPLMPVGVKSDIEVIACRL